MEYKLLFLLTLFNYNDIIVFTVENYLNRINLIIS